MPRFEDPSQRDVFVEIEREGLVVRQVSAGRGWQRTKEKTHETEDAARFAVGREVQRLLRRCGYVSVGPCQVLAAPPPEPVGSALLMEAYFSAADARFVPELLRVTAAGTLAALAERWHADPRPWARQALLAYIDEGCARPAHRALVKRLFKIAEKLADDEAMAHFLVAFDGFEQRVLVKASRRGPERVLRGDPSLPRLATQFGPKAGDSAVFSRVTRMYLRRRAYRYFRHIAHGDVARYGRAMRIALPLYRDDALDSPAKLLDAWGLMHTLYRYSPAIVRNARGVHLAREAKLADLAPAPHVPAAWTGVFPELVAVLVAARSRTVRAWLITWLREHHARELAQLAFAQVKALITSPHEELQTLGADMLPSLAGLEALPLGEWLELLAIENLDLLPIVCTVVEKHVTPVRLTLDQCITLACAKTAPVARLGLAWARAKRLDSAQDLRAVTRLAKAGVASVRDEGVAWVTGLLGTHPRATPEHLRDLCDAPHADARVHALAAVAKQGALATPALWFALAESPYEDVRAVVVASATRWRAEAPRATLRHVWTTAMLDVHRGSTTKRRVPRQIAERIASHPDEAPELLPILRLALRSVRPAERATALAALVRAVHADAALRALARELIPELEVSEQVTS